MEYICLIIGLLILLTSLLVAIKKRFDSSIMISAIMLGVFFSTFFMVLPTEWSSPDKSVFDPTFHRIVSSLLYSFKTLGGRQDIAQLESINLSGWVKGLYIYVNYISFDLAPILASGLILSFIGDTGDKMRYFLSFSPKCYVFSDINENSLALAKGIKQLPGKKTLVFCNEKEADKAMASQAKELGAILLYKLCKDVKITPRFKQYEFFIISDNEDVNIELTELLIDKKDRFVKSNITINTFAQSGTNINMLEQSMKKSPCVAFDGLTEKTFDEAQAVLKKKPSTKVAFFNTAHADNELLEKAAEKNLLTFNKPWNKEKVSNDFYGYDITLYLESSDNGFDTTGIKCYKNKLTDKWFDDPLKVRFIDEIALFCNNLLYEHPLYNLPDNKKDISVMIVGCGKLGMRMLKTVVWNGQIEGYTLKICIYDKNAKDAKQKLYHQCPELNQYSLNFIDVDIESAEFDKKISENSLDATFVCVASGSDDLNITTAENLYRIFRQQTFGYTPPIFTRIRKIVKSENYNKKDSYLYDRNIHLFGTTESIYSNNTLFNSKLEKLALAIHLCYSSALDKPYDSYEFKQALHSFFCSEYNRRSSMATALHIASKLVSCNVMKSTQTQPTEADLEKFSKILDDDLLEIMIKNEHDRWNAFVRSEGYICADVKTVCKYAEENNSHKDEISKLHPCILSWEDLSKFQKDYDEILVKKHGLKKQNFKDYDKDIIKKIPEIVRKANQLCEENVYV